MPEHRMPRRIPMDMSGSMGVEPAADEAMIGAVMRGGTRGTDIEAGIARTQEALSRSDVGAPAPAGRRIFVITDGE